MHCQSECPIWSVITLSECPMWSVRTLSECPIWSVRTLSECPMWSVRTLSECPIWSVRTLSECPIWSVRTLSECPIWSVRTQSECPIWSVRTLSWSYSEASHWQLHYVFKCICSKVYYIIYVAVLHCEVNLLLLPFCIKYCIFRNRVWKHWCCGKLNEKKLYARTKQCQPNEGHGN